MALLRKLLYKKPPDGLIGIFERIYVFDCCFTTEAWEQKDYKVYVGNIITQFKDHYPESSIMIFNFREGDTTSRIAAALSEYDLTIIDYPRHYEGCPLLPIEVINHFLKSSENWLSLGQQNILLMHSEIGGWPVVAFMLAALLLLRKNFTGENKTLDLVYKQAPRDLLPVTLPMNPIPSQLRYLQYMSKKSSDTECPPVDKALTLDCVIIRMIPDFDGKGGCCPIFRIYGRDPLLHVDKTPKLLFSTPRRSKNIRYYNQAECELVKIDINCHIQGDVVLECISLHEDMGREKIIYRAMFNTEFIKSNMLMLNREEIDMYWDAKDKFHKDFRTELLFSEMDASASMLPVDLSCFEEEGLPMEAFARVQEMFSSVDWLVPKSDDALDALHKMPLSHIVHEMLETKFHQRTEASNLLQMLAPKRNQEDKNITLSESNLSLVTDAGGNKVEGPRSDSSPPHIILTCSHPSVSEKLVTLHEGATSSAPALPADQSSSSRPTSVDLQSNPSPPGPSQNSADAKDGPPPSPAPPPPPPLPGGQPPSAPPLPSISNREDQTLRNEQTSAAPTPPAPPPAPAPPAPPASRPPPPPSSSAPPVPPPPAPSSSSQNTNSASHISGPPPPPPQGPSSNGNVKGGAAPTPPPSLSEGSSTAAPSPPPPLSKGRVLSRTTAVKSQPTKKLKPLHWLKLNRAAQGSLWAEAQKSGEAGRAPDIDMSELEHLFSAANPNDKAGKSKAALSNKPEIVHLIEHRRAYNCEIMLSKVKIPLHELMDSVLALDESAMDVDQVDNLIKFCPTKEEADVLKAYKGEKEKLGKCELFFMELLRVPRTEAKLRVLSFKLQFTTRVSDLRKSLNNVYSASEQIRSSVKLRRVMQTILSLGNALNQGTARGAAVGFKLDSLPKLNDTRARNNKMTLMHYLCKVIADKLPELLDFSKELSSLEPASKIQAKQLAEDMSEFTTGLEAVVHESKMCKKDGSVSKRFRKSLKKFIGSAEGEAKSLVQLYTDVGNSMDALSVYFGEDPKSKRYPFEQVIASLLTFVRLFNQAHDENCKQIEAEKKRAEKEAAANEKLKLKNHANVESELTRNAPIKSAE